jgi:putative tryptophan/tyrosine transport system substrate-binding protein
MMKRREVIALLGGAAVAWPLTARAQQAPLIGYLATIPLSQHESLIAAFRRGMEQAGFVDGRNVRMEYRTADGRTERLPMLAAELVGHKVNLLAGMGGITAALAAKAAASNIPVIFTAGDADPVQAGLVQSLSRPGGNVTGFSFLGGMLGAKRLEILRELVPRAEVIGVLVNPLNQTTEIDRRELETAIVGGRQRLVAISVGPNGDLASAFAASKKIDALVVTADPTFTNRRTELAVLTARLGIPAIYQWNLFVQVGGLISYGAELADGYRQAGVYAARVLKGEKPADLPVLQPTKFVLSINLKTAQALGLTVPPTLLARADDVIE